MQFIVKRKKLIWSIALMLLFTFVFTFIGAPYNTAYAMEVTAAPKMIGEVPPLADNLNKPKSFGNAIVAGPSDLPAKPGKNRIEIPSRRNANSKMFLEPNGTFSVDVYPQSIFYKNNKLQWIPIESDIVSANNGAFNAKSKANRFGVLFAPNSKVRFQQKDSFIDMQPAGAKQSQGVINGNKIKYSDVYQNTDIEYTSGNDMLKEDIILNSADVPNKYTFDINTGNLDVKKDSETGNLTLYDKKGNAVAYFMPPVMTDASKVTSDKVTLEYVQNNGKDQLVVTADSVWLNDPERKFPVKVDPTIFPKDVTRDTFVSNWYPSSQFSSYNYLSSGNSSYNGTTRSFIQYTLPSLPSSSTVTGGSFSLYQYLTGTAATVDVHKITSSWTGTGTTWNSQPTYNSTAETGASIGTTGYITFLISNLVKSWYAATTPNYGVIVKHRTETDTSKEFISSNNDPNTSSVPYMTINYTVDPIGQEDQWGFAPEGVNGFNGNLSLSATDVSIPGRGIPVSFSRTYNSRSAKSGILGYGWTSNVEASIKDSGNGPVILIDEDGTEHIFAKQADGTFTAPTGVYLTLTKDYTYNTYTVTRTDGTKIDFNSLGQITKISDTKKTPNATTYSYTSGKLSSITDASGRITNFYYDANGRLSRILDPASRNVYYGYDANGNLTTVTDQNSKVTTYGYDTNHNLTSITDPNNKTVTYGYDTANDRVSSITRTITVGGTPTTCTTSMTYDTVNNTATRTDARNNQTKYGYDPEGKITQIIQDPGSAPHLNYTTSFSYDTDNNVSQVTDPQNGNYTATYEQGKGNLLTEKNPLNEQNTYGYDSNNNKVQQINPKSNVNNYPHDKYNNELEDTDAYTQSSADRYSDNGNVQYETSQMSAGENMVNNNSAEVDANSDGWPDEWNKYWDTGSSAYFFWSTANRFGNRSFGIGDTTSWATIMNTRPIFYDSTKSYVLSGYIKTDGLSNKAAFIKVDCYDINGNWVGEVRSPMLGGTADWTRVQVLLTSNNMPAGTYKFYASAGREAATGYSRYDGIQVEVSPVQSAYNMVENASFELDTDANNIPDKWSVYPSLGTGEGRDTTKKFAGSASHKIIGQSGSVRSITQRLYVKGDQTSKLSLSGWSYADNPDPAGGEYSLKVQVNYTDNTTGTFANDFTKENHSVNGWEQWEHVVAQITPTKAFSSIDVYYCFYNQRGNAWFDAMRLQEGNNISSYYYDTLGNYVTSVKDTVGNTTTFEYDAAGNRTKVIDAKNNSTNYVYDLMNRLTQVTDAKLGVTTYGYDDNGNRTTVTDARNHTTTYGYNEINQVKSITDPKGNITGFDYDKVGNQTAITYPGKNGNPNSYNVNLGYDVLDRLISIGYNGTDQYTFGYDSKGNRTSMTTVKGTGNEITSYEYDTDNKLKKVIEPLDSPTSHYTTGYSYDSTGNVTDLTTTVQGTAYTTSYQYNALDNFYKIFFGSFWGRFINDENGNLVSTLLSNNTKSFNTYDDANRLSKLQLLTGASGNLGNYGYTYDANSNIESVTYSSDTIGSGTISYTYDELNRLTKETLRDGSSIEYTYDAAGNRATKKVGANTTTYGYNEANELTTVGGTTYAYDKNGNLIDDGSKLYEYDYNNRLTKVTNKSNGIEVASYEYDADGRRTKKTVGTTVTKYYYDGDSTRVLYETDGSGNLQVRYIYGDDYKPVAMVRGASTYFYHYNGHGDVVALTDATGAVVAEYDYDAYGLPMTTGLEGSIVNPFRYAGYYYDAETGFYYLNARYYWANVGRFITRDMFHGFENEPASLNQYNYAQSNPVMNVDPFGYWAVNIISVKWAAAAFNTAISVAIGGVAAGAIQAYVRRVGAKAAARIFTKTIASRLKAWGANKLAVGIGVAVNIFINYFDIGTAIAKWIDARDKRPNNKWITI